MPSGWEVYFFHGQELYKEQFSNLEEKDPEKKGRQ